MRCAEDGYFQVSYKTSFSYNIKNLLINSNCIVHCTVSLNFASCMPIAIPFPTSLVVLDIYFVTKKTDATADQTNDHRIDLKSIIFLLGIFLFL